MISFFSFKKSIDNVKPAFNCLIGSVNYLVRTRCDRVIIIVHGFFYFKTKKVYTFFVCARTTANKSTYCVDKLLVFVMHNGLTTQITTNMASRWSCRCNMWVWLEHIGYRCSHCILSSQVVAVVGSSYAVDLGTSPVKYKHKRRYALAATKIRHVTQMRMEKKQTIH